MELERALQVEYNDIINKSGISLVTCPDCGNVLLTRNDIEVATCPHCGAEEELAWFPDLFHDGMTWRE